MTYRNGFFTGIIFTVFLMGAGGAAYWLVTNKPRAAAKPAPPPAPATIAKTLKEDQITTTQLTPEAMQRLALSTGLVETKPIRRLRFYGGEITIPAGQLVIVSAPLSGTLKAPKGGMPQPGETVKKGQPLFELTPLLTPESQANLLNTKVDAEGQCKNARTQLEQSEKALKRAKALFKSEAGSKRAVEEAQTAYDVAKQTLKATQARCDLLDQVLGLANTDASAPITIRSPDEGTLRNMTAMPGQTVPAGEKLFEVVRLQKLWVRVPVYVGEQPEIDASAEALVGNLTGRGEELKQSAKPVAAPPSANAVAGTVDLFYELDNHDAKYSPGQRVGVTVTLRSEAASLTVPWKAVVQDLYGGAWVYEQTGERTFVRRRVLVRYVSGDIAVLAIGPASGTKVVTAGAAELFGAETGFTK